MFNDRRLKVIFVRNSTGDEGFAFEMILKENYVLTSAVFFEAIVDNELLSSMSNITTCDQCLGDYVLLMISIVRRISVFLLRFDEVYIPSTEYQKLLILIITCHIKLCSFVFTRSPRNYKF